MGELQSNGLMGSTNRKVSHDGDVCFETEMEQMRGNSLSNTQFYFIPLTTYKVQYRDVQSRLSLTCPAINTALFKRPSLAYLHSLPLRYSVLHPPSSAASSSSSLSFSPFPFPYASTCVYIFPGSGVYMTFSTPLLVLMRKATIMATFGARANPCQPGALGSVARALFSCA